MTDQTAWHAELEARRKKFEAVLAAEGCDAGLVFGCDGHAQDFRYLTNFVPILGDSWLVAGADWRCVLTFQWQIAEAIGRSGMETWEAAFDPIPLVVAAVAHEKSKRLGVVGLDRMPVPAFQALTRALADAELVDVTPGVRRLRRRKSPVEIKALRTAARLTDGMLDVARARAREGVTENELSAALATVPLESGGALAFPSTVVSGLNEPVAIRMPTARRLERGDSVMIDLGAEFDGYQADATRTFVLGRPSEKQKEVWDVVLAAYDAAVKLARPGVPCRELHRVSSKIIEGAGYKVAHRIGHGIGLATSYEWPSLDTEEARLEPGVTICIEPGVYTPGAGNMKLEDDVLITEDGCEILTRSDRSLEIGG